MENKKLIAEHDESTKFCSFQNHMREVSTTYDKIIEKGKEIVPDVLEYLRETQGGVSIMLLLWDILKISPYLPEKVIATSGLDTIEMYSIDVARAREAWIQFGIKEKLIL